MLPKEGELIATPYSLLDLVPPGRTPFVWPSASMSLRIATAGRSSSTLKAPISSSTRMP